MKVIVKRHKETGHVEIGDTPLENYVADVYVQDLREKFPEFGFWARRVNPDGTLMKRFYVTWCIRESSIVEARDEQEAYDIVQRGDEPEGGSAYVCNSFTADEIEHGD